MTQPIQLIVGLANPGEKYQYTRHNAGAWFIDALLNTTHGQLRLEPKFHGLHTQIKLATHDCHLLIPTTFMNLSGQSVRAVADYFKIPSEAILVAHDEIDLPIGTIRLKQGGGHGGHNGLRDILQHLQQKVFQRLRIGVGHPNARQEVVNYVLSAPSKKEYDLIAEKIQRAVEIMPELLLGHFQKAMASLHTD